MRLGNGTRATYTYDSADRLTRLVNIYPNGTTISSFGYKLDNVGNRTRVVESNGDVVTWTYDSAYQIKSERRSGANAYHNTFTYDNAGNKNIKNASGRVHDLRV